MSESHPEASEDNRYKETEKIAQQIQPERSAVSKAIEDKLPNLQSGETERQETSADSTSREQSNQRSDDKQTLLLVEDNLINQKVLRRQLQSRGFEVFTADNGQEAIDAVAKRGQIKSDNPNDRNYFDCILMDQEMPIKDGNAATREIRQLQTDGKAGYSHILGVSANVREAQTRSMRESGMDDIISKPFKVEDLVKRIKSIAIENSGKNDNEKLGKQGPPSEDTGANKEVRMLEDVPIRSKPSDGKSPHGRIEVGGNAIQDATKTEEQESKDRKDGREGKKSGREGEDRGGERSQIRDTHKK
jgi:CheY-like chemotaxis protein